MLSLAACGSPPPAAAPTPPVSSPAAVPSAVPSSASSPSAVPGADCVGRTLGRMSLADRAGQVLMVGTSVNAPGGLANAVQKYRLGGVFLHGRSTHSAKQLRTGVAALQKRAAHPLLISLDQEGGNVQTLKGRDFPRRPTAEKLGAGPASRLRDATSDEARRLAAIGVTMNLAPVADTVPAALGEGNPPIGFWHRQYGSDPAKVAAAVRTVVPASQDAGVLTVLKHFPGLGRVRANTDTSTKAVDKTATVDDPYLQPFKAGIQAGSAAVMMSSASYPALDRSAIAAFSRPIVTGLLRDRLGYRGLIMSDDLGAGVAVFAVPPGQRAVRFVAAGGDLVLTIRPADAATMTRALTERAEDDPAFDKRLTEATQNVLRTKERAGLLRC
ncbi:glycoside hydrolase family 3 N-terminal domain-containing protein [Paractinoplanes rishiriensis]|uniref:glycoside hydrolase family 3 N-terminal domain-containing protein n=1 Tax=Paractinoplanes rishiriensis TaxID=1050105 RepID=UPI001EF2C5C1|nr:glycoside hydrolase family 3 N-terminal domain-containing protein [Actinoplanes rishiriensis]